MSDGALKGIEGLSRIRIACAGVSVMVALAVIVQSLCLAFAITELWQGAALSGLMPYVAGSFAAYLFRLSLGALQDAISARFAESTSAKLQASYLEALATVGPELVRTSGEAACVLDATDGVDRVRAYLADAIPKQVSLAIVPLCLCACIFALDLLSGIITLICLPFIVVFMRLIGHTASDAAARRHARFAQMSNHFIDALRGMSTLRAFGRARTYGRTVFAASERFRRLVMSTLRTATLSSTVLDIFATCGLAAVAIMLGFRMVEGDVLFYPALCVLLLVPELFMPVRAYARGYHATLDGASALAAIEKAILFAQGRASLEVEYESIEDERALERALARPGVPEVSVCGVSIARAEGSHVLSDASLRLAGARVVVITGPSGSGKSSLLDVLAGFSDPSSGHLCVNGQRAETLKRPSWARRVAYIPQRPHLFAATLRDNVALYRRDATDEDVLAALACVGLAHLADDARGLDLMLGEGGRQLSGGEAHRIALARCLVDPARDVVVLDEPTAHLDIETELKLREVFMRVLDDRMLIIATHRMHWVDLADIHVRIEDGRITCSAPPICASRGADAALEPTLAARAASLLGGEAVEQARAAAPSAALRWEGRESVADLASPLADATPPCRSREGSASARRAHASGARLLRSILRPHIALIAIAVSLACVAALFACGLMFTSGYMISVAAALPVTVLALHLPSIFVRIFGVGKPLIDYIERLVRHDWVLRATSKLRQRLFDAARRAEDALRPEALGAMLATLSEDIKSLQDLFIRCAFPLAVSLFVVAFISIASFILSPLLGALIAPVLIAASIGCGVVALLTDRGLLARLGEEKRALYLVITDDVLGLRDVILAGSGHARARRLGAMRASRDRIQRTLDAHRRARSFICQALMGCAVVITLVWAAGAFAPFTSGAPFSGSGASPAVAALSSFAVQNEQPWPPNWIAAFAICLFPLIEFILPATEALLDGHAMRKGVDGLSALIDAAGGEGEEDPVVAPSVRDASACASPEGGAAVSVAIDRFAYPGSDQAVLTDVSLSVPPATLCALIGPSGAGKTTLMKAIAGYLPGMDGCVRTSGSIGLIEQDPYIFNRSLRENLLIAKGDADDDELACVLEEVGLKGLVERLPKGLDSVLASGGEDVSGGEATRIALARALLADFDIVMLDEPFKALDPDTERAVMAVMQKVLEGKTTIVVTHHLQGMDAFDHVAFLEAGSITMQGAPDALAREDPRFRSLLSLG